MRLFEYDAYASITRFIDRDEPLVIVDVGANEGLTAERMLAEFPNATVHAFEPSPETFDRLRAKAESDRRIRPEAVACGSRAGEVDFHVTANHWCSSVLAPSALGKRYYGDWYETKRVVKVPLVTLDGWARERGVDRVDFLKVDAQGYDLEVLRGATGVLRSVRAINCECQFAAEYEGCGTFSEVDLFLRGQGFALHQVHEVWSKGEEEQTSYADALWVRAEVLERFRGRKDMPNLSPKGRVARALARAAARGATRAALFGCGQHTRRLAEHLDGMPLPVVAIIDDNRALHGERISGRPVAPQSAIDQHGVDVVVLSSDAHEAALWRASAGLRARGVAVISLYGRYEEAAPAGAVA